MAYIVDSKMLLISCFIVLGIINIAYYLKCKRQGSKFPQRVAFVSLFVLYMSVLASFTLMPILVPPMYTEEFQYNINLGEMVAVFSDRSLLIDTAGNVMLFIPVGVIGYLARIKGFQTLKGATVFSLTVATAIELIQGFETWYGFADFPAVTDINDIITNTVGGTVGYILIKKYRSQKC